MNSLKNDQRNGKDRKELARAQAENKILLDFIKKQKINDKLKEFIKNLNL